MLKSKLSIFFSLLVLLPGLALATASNPDSSIDAARPGGAIDVPGMPPVEACPNIGNQIEGIDALGDADAKPGASTTGCCWVFMGGRWYCFYC